MARKRRGRGKAAAAAAARLTKKKENNGEPENEGVPEEEEMEVEDTVDTVDTVEAEKENEEIKEESMSIDNVEDNEVENKNIKGENIKAKTQQLNENESSKEGTTDEIQEMQSLKPANKIENKPNLETNMVKVVAMPIDRIMNSESSENEDLDDGQLKLDLGEDDVVEDDEEEDDDDDDEENELDVRVISDGESEMNSNSAQGVQDNTSSSTGSGATAAVDPSEMVKNQLNQIQQQVMSHIMSYQANIMAQFQQLQSQMLAQATGNTNVDTAATAPPALDLTTKPPDLLNFTNSQPNNSMLNTTKSCGASNGTSAAASSSTSQLQIRGGSRNTVKKSFSINEYDETHESESSGYRSPSPEMMAASSHDMNSVNSFINRKRHAPKHLNVFDLDEMDGPTMNPPCFKRKRTAFNEKQYNVLETTFEHNNFPEPIDQHCIALRIKTPYRSIKMWFQNRRASVRKKLAPSERGAPGEDGIMKSASDPDARWYCNLCPSTFIAKKFLDRHKDLHKTNTVSCSNCHMKFTHKLLLDTHRISKCSSKAGVDLSHINDDEDDMEYSKRVIEDYNRRMQSSLIGTSSAEDVTTPVNKLPLLMTLQQLGKQQQQQRIGQSSIGVNQVLVNAQHQHEENDSDDPDEGQSLEQLLMTQVKKAQERKRQEMLRIEQPERVQKLLKKRFETQNVGLTIIPMPGDNADDPIKIKEEVPEPDYVIDDNQHPSTLQDQITSILEAEKRASAKEEWLSSNITIKHELDDSENPASSGIKDSPAVTQQKRQTMHDQIQTILRQQKQLMNNSSKPTQDDDESEDVDMNMLRRRRRTTIFSESQLRILYLHYTYNNFPDPSMFKIIGYLAKLDAQVIKIWFQNERSRQRKRAKHIMEEANAPTKNYKCRECGMRFAMLTFLVKHSMRHIGDMDESSPEKICPICQEKCDKDQLVGHLRQTHNVNMNLLEEHRGGLEESLTCHLCKQKFKNQDELMMHKHTHLTDDYGEPPTCAICKTTFVNAICLEAHFQTHDVENWEFKCDICKAIFYDKLLVTSHQMGHGIQSASDDFTDRYGYKQMGKNIHSVLPN
ncbi:unnamed protein product [Meganyctiphanes norvegica]|uniref:Uncharacterized protein n=1 Tax=Meganyctiphanes norvegica TaxID=48144 RepID=A0AAV2QM36_MEGNR